MSPIESGILWEGTTYYLDLTELTRVERQKLIEMARLEEFAQFDDRNPVCSFTLNGYIGTVDIGDRNFDIRSRKLDIEQPGNEQFATLLAEIDAMIANLIFKYESPAIREADETLRDTSPSSSERLDFFRTRMIGPNFGKSIVGTVRRILANPHNSIGSVKSQTRLEMARKADLPRFAKSAWKADVIPVKKGSFAANNRAAVTSKTGEVFLPRYLPTTFPVISYDTVENRFLRFFLEDIEGVCLSVLRDHRSSQRSITDAEVVLASVRELLSAPIFRGIGKLHYLPSHSPVLVGNEAYNKVFTWYLRSRLSAIDPLKRARDQLRTSPLKDVASLYEIWVFFKLAVAFLGNGPQVTVTNSFPGALVYGTTWSVGDVSVAYNRTFYAKRGSYSVTLRPDVTVQVGARFWLFDAKYKSDRPFENIEDAQLLTSANVKKVDLHKMHTYVDAIVGAHVALAVYPGSEVTLFSRLRKASNDIGDLCSYGGVGGIPLLPLTSLNVLAKIVAGIKASSQP